MLASHKKIALDSKTMRLLLILCFTASFTFAEEKTEFVQRIVPWLLDEKSATQGIPFADVIAATSNRKVLPVD